MKLVYLLSAIFLITACGSGEKKPTEEQQQEYAQKRELLQRKFNEALAFLDSGQFNKAGIAFKKILRDHPTNEFELMIIYNLGGALEGLGKCEKSAERYRQVINKSLGRQKRLEAQAQLRLSYVYECLGDDAKVIATLLSLRKKDGLLPVHVIKAEVPARLAAAYARQGNRSMAKSFFVKAQDGLKEINTKTRNPKKKKDLLSKTLYFMGSMKKLDIEKLSPELFLESLAYLQNYLLMSVELDHIEWSPKSATEILDAYDDFYKFAVSQPPVNSRRDRGEAEKRSKRYELSLVNIYNLKQQRIPDENEPRIVTQLFAQLDERDRKIKNALAKLTNGNELTPEALERQSLRQPGRVLSKETVLERRKAKK